MNPQLSKTARKIYKIKVTSKPSKWQTQPDLYYTPIIIQDQFNNKYLAISHYEATSIKTLMEKLKDDYERYGKFNTGDWWEDLPTKIDKFLEANP